MAIGCKEAKDLLDRHNPRLVILPRPDSGELARPYESDNGLARGDFHPQRVGAFLAMLERYDEVRPFEVSNILRPDTWPWPRIRKWPKFPWNWANKPLPPPLEPEMPGSDTLRDLVANSPIGVSRPWELDLRRIRSQDPDQAWQVYRGLLDTLEKEQKEPVVYGRCTETTTRIILQYWYFYIYNDNANKHEGDWEMASVVLTKPDQKPEKVGYAGHSGGAQRSWAALGDPAGQPLGNRPYLYVAWGSHAAYLDHMPKGHKSVHVEYLKTTQIIGPILDYGMRLLSRVLFFVGVRDYTAAHPEDPGATTKGIELNPTVIPMPERADLFQKGDWEVEQSNGKDLRQDPEWWWMHLDCRWGSSHSRFFASIGPEPPWMKQRWAQPLTWVEGLNER